MPDSERLSGRAARLRLAARRRAVPAARAAYAGLERSPLAFLLRVGPVQRLKSRVTYVPQERVVALMDAIERDGVHCWIAGGWGIDALLGRQTRRHYDLDLVVGETPDDVGRLGQVLAREGFRPGVREFNPGLLMPVRHSWQDDRGCTVEVMPVALSAPPFCGAAAEAAPEPPFTLGTIGGAKVPCLSASLQFVLHEGYAARNVDRTDLAALRSHLDMPDGAQPS